LTAPDGGATVRRVDTATAIASVVVGVLALIGLLATLGFVLEAGGAALRR
jgi:hypothetical protein